jgi:large subunit ribosomal protein L21
VDYAVIRVGGKQHKVRDGETLVVDRVSTDVGGTFEPDVLLGDGTKVVVTVLAHERGPKIRIGKYRRRTGYKRHNGFRAATSRIEITIGEAKKRSRPKKETAPVPAEAEVAEVGTVEADAPEFESAAVETTAVETTAVETEPPAVEEPAAEDAPDDLPEGYADMTVADIGKAAKGWQHDQLVAAREYEQAHAARKGALAAIESALAHEQTEDETDDAEEDS